MQKLFFLCFFLCSIINTSAQITNEQITGNWKMIIKQGERVIEVREWSFSKDGTGRYYMNSDAKNTRCATSESFTYRIQGENIFITPIVREKGCAEKRGPDDELIKTKEKAEPYSLQIVRDAADKLSIGGMLFTKY